MNGKEITDWSEKILGECDKHTYPYEERERIAQAALDAVDGAIVEVGTFRGISSSVLVKVAQQKKVRALFVDPLVWHPGCTSADIEASLRDILCKCPDAYWRMYPFTSKVACELATSSVSGQGGQVAPFIDHNIGFLHIDGDHDGVDLDCSLWFPHLKPKATVAFHDANPHPRATDMAHHIVRDAQKWTEGWEDLGWSRDKNCLMIRRMP